MTQRAATATLETRQSARSGLASVVLPTRHRPAGTHGRRVARPRRQGRTRAVRKRRTRARARPRVRPAWNAPRLVAALGSGAFWLLLALLWWHPAFRVDAIQVQGLVRMKAARLEAWPGLEEMVGRPVVTVDPAELARRLQEAFPVFRRVEVQVLFPGVVRLVVEERTPVLVWQEGGQVFWMDESGVKFYPMGQPEPTWPRVRVVDAASGTSLAPGEVALLLELAQKTRTRELVYHPRYGVGWQAPEGWQVYLGRSLEDWEARWGLYQEVRRALLEQGKQPAVLRLLSPRAVVILPQEEGTQP